MITCSIQEALRLRDEYGKIFLSDAAFMQGLERYRNTIDHTQATLRRTGVVTACTDCADRTGSCCFREVEEWYDPMLLLLNLLLGVEIPCHREVSDQCLFLGSTGCKLLARYSFCLNYLCPDLRNRLGPEGTGEVLSAVGRELSCGWMLEQTLMQRAAAVSGKTAGVFVERNAHVK